MACWLGRIKKRGALLTFQRALASAPLAILAASVVLQLAWLVLRWGTAAQAVWYADVTFLLVIYASLGLCQLARRPDAA